MPVRHIIFSCLILLRLGNDFSSSSAITRSLIFHFCGVKSEREISCGAFLQHSMSIPHLLLHTLGGKGILQATYFQVLHPAVSLLLFSMIQNANGHAVGKNVP